MTWSGSSAKALREAQGLSRWMVASELGVHPSTIWAWEQDRQEPRFGHAVALARILGVAMDEFTAPDATEPAEDAREADAA